MSLPIGEVSRRSGLSADALRFYEREGIIPPPERTGGGERRYDPAVLDHLQVVTSLRRIGFGLDEVRDLLSAKSQHSTIRGRVEAARASIDRLESQLDEKERALAEARAQLRSWRAELDAGEPWPDAPVSVGDRGGGGRGGTGGSTGESGSGGTGGSTGESGSGGRSGVRHEHEDGNGTHARA